MNRPKAVAMVSGGLDSVVSLARALKSRDVRLVLFFDYGQRSRESERVSVLAVTNFYDLPFRQVDISWLEGLSPEGMRSSVPGDGGALETLDDVWIPNRNGVFISVAAAFAESYGCDEVICGFNREEAIEFPDNSARFVEYTNRALELSTRGRVTVKSFTQDLDKREILRDGVELGAPLSIVWSCYRSGEHMCGRCASCLRLKVALDATPPEMRPVIEFDA